MKITRLFLLLGLFSPMPAVAEDVRGTAEEAQAMVAQAIADFDAEGDALFAAINAGENAYIYRDLYVFVADPNHIIVAHGTDPTRLGKNLTESVDITGSVFGEKMVEEATEEGVWIDYVWRDPMTGEQMAKSSWVVSHADYIFGCGIYKPE